MKINIEDINYVFSHKEMDVAFIIENYSANTFFTLLKKWIYIVIKGFLSTRFFLIDIYKHLGNSDYVFIAFTDNNYRSLNPIKEKMQNAAVYTEKNLPLQKVWFHAMLFSPVVFLKYVKSYGYLKKSYACEFISYCLTYGYYIEAKKILKTINPKVLVVANDHSFPQRAFFRVAQKLDIITVYTQHASVTENFPALEFDYAFLDGRESMDKYTANRKPCKSKVFLSGSCRFDIVGSQKTDTKKNSETRCGIAINSFDRLSKVKKLIDDLHKIKNIRIVVRPHPEEDIDFWKKFASDNNCHLSDPKQENPFSFIAANDFFISGESSFHLDVALARKKSYYYKFTEMDNMDCYGYLKNDLIEDITSCSYQRLLEITVWKHEPDLSLLRYYVANFATSYWGDSAGLIAETIAQVVQSQIPACWKLDENGVYVMNVEIRNV